MLFIAVYSIFVLSAAVMVVRRPATALVIVYCLFVFEQWAQAQNILFVRYSWLTNVIGGMVILLAAGVRYFKGAEHRSDWSFGALIIWVLFCFALLSASWSENPKVGLEIWKSQAPPLILALVLVPWIVRGTKDLMPVYQSFLVVGLVLTVLIYTTTEWTGRTVVFGDGPEVLTGNPLEVATVGGLTMLVAILLGENGRFGLWGFIRLAAIFLGILVAVRTGSRGQVIAAVLVIIPMLFFKEKMSSPKSILATSIVGLAVFILVNLAIEYQEGGGRFEKDLAIHDMAGRFGVWADMLAAWFSSPNPFRIFIGLGSSSSYYVIGGYPHNVLVEILTETGVVGFSLYLAMLIWLFVMTMRRLKQESITIDERNTIYLASSIFLYFLLLTFKQGNMMTSYAFFMSGMVLAGLVGRRI